MTGRRLTTLAFRGQYWAAAILPVCLVVGTVLAGGGLLMAGFTLLALPLAALLALPPSLGSWLGKIRRTDDAPLAYAVVTIALWLAVLPVGFLATYGQPWPSYAEAPAGVGVADVLGRVAVTSTVLLWTAQVVLAVVRVRARRSVPAGTTTAPGPATS